jgi:hypothetical protein
MDTVFLLRFPFNPSTVDSHVPAQDYTASHS